MGTIAILAPSNASHAPKPRFLCAIRLISDNNLDLQQIVPKTFHVGSMKSVSCSNASYESSVSAGLQTTLSKTTYLANYQEKNNMYC